MGYILILTINDIDISYQPMESNIIGNILDVTTLFGATVQSIQSFCKIIIPLYHVLK
jgi:hypothetical protein